MEADDQKLCRVIARAWAEPGFKKRLKEDPRTALAEMGVSVEADLEIKTIESTGKQRYFVLPPAPDGQNSIDQLQARATKSDFKALVHVLYNVCCC